MSRQTPVKRARRNSAREQLELRNAIVDAALAIYASEGLPALTMRSIAAAVGVTPMALYRYFANKSELLQLLGEAALTELADVTQHAVDRHVNAVDRLRAATRAFIDYWESHPDHYQLVYVESARPQQGAESRRLAETVVYRETLQAASDLLEAYADALGADHRYLALARDLRLSMALGYLQASLANTRYPWHDKSQLRECVIETIVRSTADCLCGRWSRQDDVPALPSPAPAASRRLTRP